jgi:hypothetical protein
MYVIDIIAFSDKFPMDSLLLYEKIAMLVIE